MSAFRIILIALSIVFSYSNYIIFESYRMQTGIVFDFNKQEFQNENYQILKNSNRDFPNLTATGFPLNALFAKYQLMFEDFNGALNTLFEKDNANPYMRIKESLLSEIYFNLGIRDSSYYYSKIAYENLPLNVRHYQQFITELTYRKDLDEINKTFLNSRAKKNHQYWLFYFTAVIRLKNENSKIIDSLALEAIKKFPTNNEIKIVSSYILVGEEKVRESYVLYEEGVKYFEKTNFNLASDRFISAYNLNPLDYSFSENAGMSLIEDQRFEEAIEYLNISSENLDKPNDGKSEFGLAICYSKLNEIELACEYLKKSKSLNYKPAFQKFSFSCN